VFIVVKILIYFLDLKYKTYMAYAKYDDFLAPSFDRGSFSNSTDANAVIYPDYNQVNVFGPIYLPRVYGKDLTAFEVASSGYIAITLNDIHSLDFIRDNATSNIVLKAYPQDSFAINVNENNVFLKMDSPSNNLIAYASNDMLLAASNTLTLTAQDLAFNIESGFNLGGNNLRFIATETATLEAQGGDLNLIGAGSNMYMIMNSNLDSNSSMNLEIYSRDNLTASAATTILNTTGNTTLLILNSATSNVTINAADTIDIASSNALNITSALNSVTLSAANNGATITLDASSNITISAANAMTMTSDNTFTVSANSNMNVSSLAALSMTSADSATLSSSNAVTITSVNSTTVTSSADVTMSANSNFTISSQSNMTMSSAAQLTLSSSNSAALYSENLVSITALDSINMSSSNNFTLNATSNITINSISSSLDLTAANGSVYTSMNALDSTVYIGASGGMQVVTSNDTSFTNANFIVDVASNLSMAGSTVQLDSTGSMLLHASGSNMSIVMDTTTQNITVTAASAINQVSLGAFSVGAGTSFGLSNTAGAKISTSDTVLNYQGTVHNFKDASGGTIIHAESNLVRINGDLEIIGTVNSTTYTVSNLTVMNKQVSLAYNSNDEPVTDGVANDKSGIVVSGGCNADARSILWNYNSGIDFLGTANADSESFWEVKGGQLRISASNNSIGDIAFGFRINQLGELEIVKKTGANAFKRIAKFGRTL
jgi:uncharacterized protein (DUF2345 family)